MNRQTVLTSLTKIMLLLGVLVSSATLATDRAFQIKVSAGATWQESNKVQIPNNDSATRFSLNDIAGSGPWPAVRLEAIWNINNKHGVRLLLAPLRYSESGSVSEPISFAGANFSTDQPITGEYKFNSWRAGYRYHLRARDNWDLWLGGTLKVRDAQIKLTQGTVTSSDDNVGLVPLLYLAGEYRFAGPWSIAADMDALGGGPGRAIDLGLSLNYSLGKQWDLGFEYRALEGGADVDDVFNFAWFNSLLISARYRS